MAVLDILCYPDARLKRVAAAVTEFDSALQQFVDDLENTMRAGPGSVGIAAPQVDRLWRVVIVDEAPATCSAASEIAALIAEDPETFRALKAPVRRVCAAPVPVPYSPTLEGAALPRREDIKAAVYEVLKESLRPA